MVADALLAKEKFTIRELAGLIGLMSEYSKGVEYGMGHYRHLEHLKVAGLRQNKGSFDAFISLSSSAAEDINWWKINISKGIRRIWTSSPSITLTTDSSGYAWGVVFSEGDNSLLEKKKTGGDWAWEDAILHINVKETKAIWIGLRTFCAHLSHCCIKIETDSTTALAYVNHQGGMRNKDCDVLARQIWDFAQTRDLWLLGAYIPGVKNTEADHESRLKYNTEWALPQKVFNLLQKKWGPFSCDLFASFLTFKMKPFVSWTPAPGALYVDAFSRKIMTNSFAFPPFSLITRTVRKVQRESSSCFLLTPRWRAQPWFGLLQRTTLLTEDLGIISLENPVSKAKWSLHLVLWRI